MPRACDHLRWARLRAGSGPALARRWARLRAGSGPARCRRFPAFCGCSRKGRRSGVASSERDPDAPPESSAIPRLGSRAWPMPRACGHLRWARLRAGSGPAPARRWARLRAGSDAAPCRRFPAFCGCSRKGRWTLAQPAAPPRSGPPLRQHRRHPVTRPRCPGAAGTAARVAPEDARKASGAHCASLDSRLTQADHVSHELRRPAPPPRTPLPRNDCRPA